MHKLKKIGQLTIVLLSVLLFACSGGGGGSADGDDKSNQDPITEGSIDAVAEELAIAAKENNKNIVKKLLSVGANINAVDESGSSALKHAQDLGYREIVKAIEDYKKLTGIK